MCWTGTALAKAVGTALQGCGRGLQEDRAQGVLRCGRCQKSRRRQGETDRSWLTKAEAELDSVAQHSASPGLRPTRGLLRARGFGKWGKREIRAEGASREAPGMFCTRTSIFRRLSPDI